ncbi:MAG: 5'-3' exonuclease [Aquificae bacterium]|nr:5'-3' exonuclease [Aquificota bacterium]
MALPRRLYLFDGSAFVYRAYHALPPLRTKDGFPTGAVFGFLRTFLAFLKEKSPTFVGVVFDSPKKSFRSELYADYKARRKPAPDDLKRQIPVIKDLLKLLGVPLVEVEGVEADDAIATLAKTFSQKGWEVVVYTPDKDMAYLLSFGRVKLVNPLTGEEITEEKVLKKFGVRPEQIPDYLALVGDKVDNVPGVPGVGPKRAVEVLSRYGSVENLVRNWDRLPSDLKRLLSKTSPRELLKWLELTRLKTDLDLPLGEEDLKLKKPDWERLKNELLRLEMKSLLKEVERLRRETPLGQKKLF